MAEIDPMLVSGIVNGMTRAQRRSWLQIAEYGRVLRGRHEALKPLFVDLGMLGEERTTRIGWKRIRDLTDLGRAVAAALRATSPVEDAADGN